MTAVVPVRRALLSAAQKTDLLAFASRLAAAGVELVSTGGTAAHLAQGGLPVTAVSSLTGAPEMLGGRVKTLHPAIHGAILARRDVKADLDTLGAHGITPIDLVLVTLYPFEQAARAGLPLAEVIEQLDVGGPALIRAAAKNFAHVVVLVDPADYAGVAGEIATGGGTSLATRARLAQKAFARTARYDAAVAQYLAQQRRAGEASEDLFPPRLTLDFDRITPLRYGENPHQRAALYRDPNAAPGALGAARVLQGKELSFSNWLDLDAAWRLVAEFDVPAAVVIKHTNPCGVATARAPADAFARARACDPLSAFGGIVGLNRAVDRATAERLMETFLEAIVAPGFDEAARQVLQAKKNLRVVEMAGAHAAGLDLRSISGGLLVQEADRSRWDQEKARVVTGRAPTDAEWRALAFAWTITKHVKSNAIVFAAEDRTLGIGAGQMSRVDAVKVAVMKAQEPLAGSAVGSDAFFPFRDGVDAVAAAGARAIVQPGGSVRDQEVIAAADEHGLAMVVTGTRHFRH